MLCRTRSLPPRAARYGVACAGCGRSRAEHVRELAARLALPVEAAPGGALRVLRQPFVLGAYGRQPDEGEQQYMQRLFAQLVGAVHGSFLEDMGVPCTLRGGAGDAQQCSSYLPPWVVGGGGGSGGAPAAAATQPQAAAGQRAGRGRRNAAAAATAEGGDALPLPPPQSAQWAGGLAALLAGPAGGGEASCQAGGGAGGAARELGACSAAEHADGRGGGAWRVDDALLLEGLSQLLQVRDEQGTPAR